MDMGWVISKCLCKLPGCKGRSIYVERDVAKFFSNVLVVVAGGKCYRQMSYTHLIAVATVEDAK